MKRLLLSSVLVLAGFVSAQAQYIAPYSGAVSRTNNSKMADIASVFDFIPVSLQAAIKAGTSTTDVSSYLTVMHAAVPAGVTFLFPSGQYNIGAGSSALTGRVIYTVGVTFTGGGSITGATATFNSSGQVTTAGIANNAVGDAQLRQGAARSVIGVAGNATANVADIQGTTDQILRVDGAGTGLGFGSIDLSKSAAVGTSILGLAGGGLGGSQAGATIGQLPVYPGSAGAAVPTTLTPINPVLLGADPAGVADSTAIINTAIQGNNAVLLPCGTFKVSNLSTTVNGAFISGSGYCTNLQYTGTTGDILTIGSAGADINNVVVANLRITAASAMSSGRGIFAQRIRRGTFKNIWLDSNLFDAFEVGQYAWVEAHNIQIASCGRDGLRVYGKSDQSFGAEFTIDASSRVESCVRDGVVAGGGAGGLRFDLTSLTNGRHGFYCTGALASGGVAHNREIFFGPNFGSDQSVTTGAQFDSACITGGFVIATGGWFAATTAGPGINIASGNTASFTFSNTHINSNRDGGIITADGGVLQLTGSYVQLNGNVTAADGFKANSPGASSQISLVGNFIGNNGVGGVGYGVNFTGTYGSYTVSENILTGNSQGAATGITCAAANQIVWGNVGYNSNNCLGTISAGVWNGTKIGLAYGGTNADLSATGGASQFLRQASAGAAVTVVRPACADLSDATSGCNITFGTNVATWLASPTNANLAALTNAAASSSSPTVTCTVGAPTYTATVAHKTVYGNVATITYRITITAANTCTGVGALLVTTPLTAASDSMITCRNLSDGVISFGWSGPGSDTSYTIQTVAGLFPYTTTATLACSGVVLL